MEDVSTRQNTFLKPNLDAQKYLSKTKEKNKRRFYSLKEIFP
tara:strand:+ start:313 stop:438 length:126 start_codon:yes stop_codon:yes gene_type:complete